jgi:formamidopyrimidine-DNA glycosylase
MPELPEVENVRRTLAARIKGKTITAVQLHRRDVVCGRATAKALLGGQRIADVARHGKQLVLIGDERSNTPRSMARSGRTPLHCALDLPCVCIHLGMSGSLRIVPPVRGGRHQRSQIPGPHTHIVWQLDDGSQMHFRDPRRFGGVWPFPTRRELVRARWQQLGADAMAIQPRHLHRQFSRTRRTLKAALLDQRLIAGLGNIYVDELLHGCGLHPLTPCRALDIGQVQRMVRRLRRLLARATDQGGSTLRDYVDAESNPGRFQTAHRVYGRGGHPCGRCGVPLNVIQVAGRTTAYCPSCQPMNQPKRLGVPR